MSVCKAVKFRFLAAQLTPAETLQFVNKLLDLKNNIIIKALFNQILNTSANQQSDADNINNMVSNIIESREKKPKPIPARDIKLDELAKPLIGEISSFLEQYDHIHFSESNRWIYLGCNSPNLLKELDLMFIEGYNYSAINLELYPSVKHLRLNLNDFYKLRPSVINELEAIELYGATSNDIDIGNFLQSAHINVDNITKLRCSHFGDAYEFPADKFLKLLAKFPNIEHLDLFWVYTTLNANDIKDLYPNLKGLRIDGSYKEDCKSLINTFGNNLDFLGFTEYESNDTNFDLDLQNTNFSKLKVLELVSPTNSKSTNDILLTAKNLKKVVVGSFAFMTPKETKQTMTKLITTCKLLRYIKFSAADNNLLEYALDGIETGLFETKELERNEIKIHIYINCSPNDLVSNIGKIIHWLDYSEINDFMFILTLKDMNDKNILLKELQSKSNYLSRVKVSRLENDFVVTNIDCKINGLNESL